MQDYGSKCGKEKIENDLEFIDEISSFLGCERGGVV